MTVSLHLDLEHVNYHRLQGSKVYGIVILLMQVNKMLGFSHLIQLVEVGRHQTDQLTSADLIQDSAGQLQGLKRSKVRGQLKHNGRK